MLFWLSCYRDDGRCMLSRYKPVRAKLTHCGDLEDIYPTYGDPFANAPICKESVRLLFGLTLKPFETVRVRLVGSVVGELQILERLEGYRGKEEQATGC